MRSFSSPRVASRGARLLLCSLALATQGCYALHAASGQLHVWWGREPIDEVLRRPDLDPTRRERLELVLAVRRFAFEELGLTRSDSYSYFYDTGEGYVAYNVSACAPDAFAPRVWTFPLVGAVPYLGYFDLALAQEQARALAEEGLDVLVLPVPAYSTLGWFADPVFSTMLDEDEAELASTIVHELTHGTVWIPGDVELNENMASFVGDRGAEAFFLARGGPQDPALLAAARRNEEQSLFNAALAELRDDLARVYESTGRRSDKLAYKAQAVAAFRRRYAEELAPRLSDDRYGWVLSEEIDLNNAVLLSFRRYHGDEELLDAVYRRCGSSLRRFIAAIREAAEADEPRAALEALAAGGPFGD
ncbi:MAG: hypothetical protein D6731_05300 [Planctomycetota bacterium]|nr:MAG: hypothetical protein D6731_05300 [Planctomycetota bacterium]